MFKKFFQKNCYTPWKLESHTNNRKPCFTPVLPGLLESLRCHSTDEYPVVSTDDEGPIPPLACSFSRGTNTAHLLGLVDENGSLVIYNTNKAGDDAIVTDWTAHSNAIFDLKWMCREEKVLTASGDQTVCLWDVKTKGKLLTFKGHTSSVRSVGFRPEDDAVFASGSRDGHVRLWDVRCNVKESKVSSVGVIRNAHTMPQQLNTRKKRSRLGVVQPQDPQQSVTSVLFQEDYLLVSGGAADGCVKVWDIRKLKQDVSSAVYQFPYAGMSKRTHGFSSLAFDSYYSRLFASCTDDVIYCYNFTSYNPQPMCTYRGHRNTSFYIKAVVSPDSKFLLSGSSDENAYIWQVDDPNASPVILKGHRSEISDVAWCNTDLCRLVTTSDDNTMRVWRIDPTVKIRKQLGQSDKMYNITGYAELTHRDIGVSAESTVKPSAQSPVSGLKRAATFPLNSVALRTPKRSKTSISATPSPSIKTWLKRSASDTSNTTTGDSNVASTSASTPKQLKVNGRMKEDEIGSIESSNKDRTSDSAKCDSKAENCTVKSEHISKSPTDHIKIRKSCKRKLEVSENESVKRKKMDVNNDIDCVRDENENTLDMESKDWKTADSERNNTENQSIPKFNNTENQSSPKSNNTENQSRPKSNNTENQSSPKSNNTENQSRPKSNNTENQSSPKSNNTENQSRPKSNITENQYSPKSVKHGTSPNKHESALQDLSSAINASPVKGEIQRREFSSPAAVRVLDLNSKSHLASPTANLPNFVVDGPKFFHNSTPQKQVEKGKRVDWLTEMRKQKRPGCSPKGKVAGSKFLDKLDQDIDEETQESGKPATPKLKSPVRGLKPITSFFHRRICES